MQESIKENAFVTSDGFINTISNCAWKEQFCWSI